MTHPEAIQAYADHCDISCGEAEDSYLGEYDTFKDYVEELVEGWLGQWTYQALSSYIAFQRFANDVISDYWIEDGDGRNSSCFRRVR